MSRYFFDLVGAEQSKYDYTGRELPSKENAYQLAELIAVDLAVEDEAPWYGWAVKVRNVQGREICSVAVKPEYLAAA